MFSNLSNDPDLLARFASDMVYTGHPQFIATASDNKTLTEIIAYGNAHQLPMTFCGSQTSMTGSSAADSGIIVPLGKNNKIIDIGRDKNGAGFVITEPGVILGDLKRAVLKEGFFYPPDPTSYNEAQIGATAATNATGEDTFKYGPTRSYVSELEIIDSAGKLRTLKREHPFAPTSVKNAAGYFLDGEEIDEVIGSEGTLAVITKLKLRLLDAHGKNVFLLILPFSSFENALKAVTKIAEGNNSPRALELIGPGAAAYFRECAQCPAELKNEDVFLYIKDEYFDDTDLNSKIETWFASLEKLYTELGDKDLLERIFIAQTTKQLEDIHACRHHIPLRVNEEFFPFVKNGGGKVGTDWWVPLKHLQDMMLWTFEESKNLGIPFLVFAHIGNGHPHWNYLTKNPDEKKRAQEFVWRQCERAVLYGGGVAGEHGIGKIKHKLLTIQHKPDVIAKMHALKLKWDPNWIFGRGNILQK